MRTVIAILFILIIQVNLFAWGNIYTDELLSSYKGKEIKKIVIFPLLNEEKNETEILREIYNTVKKEIFSDGRFEIIDRENLDKILDEQKLSMSGLIDNKDAVKYGKIAGADLILVMKKKGVIVDFSIINSENAKLLAFDSLKINILKNDLSNIISSKKSNAGIKINSKEITANIIADSKNFPEVSLIVNLQNKDTRKGLYNLDRSNFKVFENNNKQEISSFISKAEGKVDPIDIVFIFDETGSMQDEINSVKNNSIAFANVLNSFNMDYRLALVTFSDKVEQVENFTSNIDDFKGWLSSIKARGGDDEPENALDALKTALSFKFRNNAKIVFILITDAPYHEGNRVTKQYMLPLAKQLKLEGIAVYPIAVNLEQYVWMARETNGKYFNILSDFSDMIKDIANVLTAQYIIKYNTTNSSFDNAWRNVEVIIADKISTSTKFKSAANMLASSQLIEKYRPSDAYKPENVIDGNKYTAWSEGSNGNGIGEWLRFGFDSPKHIKAINIISGYAKTPDIFRKNNRVKKLKLIFSDGRYQIVNLKDTIDFQKILVDRDKPTQFIILEIQDVYKGLRYNDTCISEVEFEYK
ncbi:MAG: VWA domain-containing protein [Spirochaetes bacterium]|nr:VWA domain-containing protein [Spirochaetota bacterium]